MVNHKLEMSRRGVLGAVVAAAIVCPLLAAAAADPLPSWNAGPAKEAIVAFVAAVTTPGSAGFVPADERIAVFDNDGTLWVEKPVYHPTGLRDRPSEGSGARPPGVAQRAAVQGGAGERPRALAASGMEGVVKLVMASHAGMTTDDFAGIVKDWLATARHPRFDRLYTSLVYQPMLELLAYLRASGFKTFIVSGGGIEFMRPWAETVYGVPPEQVVGSSIKTRFEMRDGTPVLVRLPEVDFIDDKAGKPVGINTFIGRKPIAAFGNSDGDLQMLQWTSGPGRRFGLIVHHDDAEREYAYDRDSYAGRLDKALDAAPSAGWTVVSMKSDWAVVFGRE